MIGAVVLAAGAGRRYGGAKQLHPVHGRPMLERVLTVVASAPVDDRVVVLGARADDVLAAVDLHGARPVLCPGWESGQSASLRCGLDALGPDVDGALVVLGDGPHLHADAVARVLAAAGSAPGVAMAADYGGGRSHPVLLPRVVWPLLPDDGETPGRAIDVQLVDCSDLPAPGDVDYAAE